MVFGLAMDVVAFLSEAGDNNCPVDKTRRNWCPACRLRKCYQMNMNPNAVQKERGPRKKKHSSTYKDIINHLANQKDLILLECVQRCLDSPVLTFVSTSQKLEILCTYWPIFFLLDYSSRVKTPQISCLNVKELLIVQNTDKETRLDSEELRLTFCLALCRIGNSCDLLSFAKPLEDMYSFWLHRHCDQFYDNGTGRANRLISFVNELLYKKDYGSLAEEFSMTPNELIRNSVA
ncbi:unnamed protein product [Enterobius vermicularis]|uniref:Nuclear receptor domain-containing protein n=1 Tax=Enterobius vermicularis TaxID=51028 RepID=A0A0N4VMJ5_ENTVE|nr:unnamed protein product [Enterobius vermicularis]